MTGIAIVVWCKDGRIKYQLHHDQKECQAHLDRLKESISPAMWNVYFIDKDMMFCAISGDGQFDD